MKFDRQIQEAIATAPAQMMCQDAARRDLYQYALDVYLRGNWRELYDSWEHCMVDTLTGHVDEDEMYAVADCIPLLARLKAHPVVRNGVRIDHTTFLNGEIDDLQYLLVYIWCLDLETPWGNHQFEECVWALFTMGDLELDHFMKDITRAKAPSFWKVRALWSKVRRFFTVQPH